MRGLEQRDNNCFLKYIKILFFYFLKIIFYFKNTKI